VPNLKLMKAVRGTMMRLYFAALRRVRKEALSYYKMPITRCNMPETPPVRLGRFAYLWDYLCKDSWSGIQINVGVGTICGRQQLGHQHHISLLAPYLMPLCAHIARFNGLWEACIAPWENAQVLL
jgi:hypothetical protein